MQIFFVVNIFIVMTSFILANNLSEEKKMDIFNRIVVEIINDCYPSIKSVMLYGEYIDGVAKNLQKLERVNLILHQNTSSKELPDPVDFYRRIESLIIIGNSSKDVPWIKNHNVTSVMKIKLIFIFDISDKYCYYQNSFNIAWTLGTSSAFHICIFSEIHQEVITYNPINNYAPASWIFKSKQILKNYSPATIFYRNYTRENLCQGFEFDRTNTLSGHTMNVHLMSWNIVFYYLMNGTQYLPINNSNNVFAIFGGEPLEYLLVESYIKYFNVSINMSVAWLPRYSDPLDDFADLISENADISLSKLSQYEGTLDQWKHIELGHPLLISNDVIATHKRGLLSPLEKIFNFYGWVTIISASVILLLTFGVVYIAEKRRVSFAFFECLRLLINNSLYSRMTNLKTRIFFSVVFLYFLIIQATFSGHLTAFLTKLEFHKNVETIDDLSDSHYTKIYARHGTDVYFANKSFINKVNFQFHDPEDISTYLFYKCWQITENISIACVDDFYHILPEIAEFNLHYTKSLGFNIWSYPVRKNWILKDHVNKILMRLDQSRIYQQKLTTYHRESFSTIERQDKNISIADYYRPIILDDLYFIFEFLIFGLSVSLIIFMIELFVRRKKQKPRKIKSILIPVGFLLIRCRDILNQIHFNRDSINTT